MIYNIHVSQDSLFKFDKHYCSSWEEAARIIRESVDAGRVVTVHGADGEPEDREDGLPCPA